MSNIGNDIKLYDTNDGAEISLINGVIDMTNGFDTAVYLSLFGDHGGGTWQNEILQGSEQIKCTAVPYARGNAITTERLHKFEKLVENDLAWFKKDGIADTINITISQESKVRVNMAVEILTNNETLYKNEFAINWNAESKGE